MRRPLQRAACLARALCAVDVRALAALRIGLSLVVLADVISRAPHAAAFLGDGGLFTGSEAAATAQWWRFSPFFWSGQPAVQHLWLLATGAAALAMLLGAQTRLATAVVWVLVSSLQMRNYQVIAGGDLVLRCCLFWSMFLPLGAAFSLDARGKRAPRAALGVPAAAFLAQVAVVYLASGFAKTGAAWTVDHSAIQHVLELRQMRTSIGASLSAFPRLLALASWAILWMERAGPILAVIPAALAAPFSVRWARRLASAGRLMLAAGFIAFHLSLIATLRLGIFPWVCCAAWLPFLPSAVWRRWPLRFAPAAAPRLRMLRDPLLLALLFYTLAWNLAALPLGKVSAWTRGSYSSGEAWMMRAAALDQSWGMFAPNPLEETQELMGEGETDQGERIAVDPKERFSSDERWRKYWSNLALDPFAHWRPRHAAWLLTGWNEAHPSRRLRSLELVLRREWRNREGQLEVRYDPMGSASARSARQALR